jgi:hypothetical protein
MAVAAAAHGQAVSGSSTARLDTLPVVHAVRGSSIRVDEGGLATMDVDPAYRYVGGHRFVLLGVADAEQHAFVVANAAGDIQRLYWIQFERYLRTAPNARYDYSVDSLMTRDGLEWRVQGRRYTSAPDPTSDRAALYALARAGLRPPLPASRVRLVHLTSDDGRSELMVIYIEATSGDGTLGPGELAGLIARAQLGLRFTKR